MLPKELTKYERLMESMAIIMFILILLAFFLKVMFF